MTVGLEIIRQEAADLDRFIEPLVRACADRREDYPVFAKPALKFFDYVKDLGLQTQAFLRSFPGEYAKSEVGSIALSKRQKLTTLRTSWESLHEYVKPALDADSLSLPMPLLAAFEDLIKEVEDWKEFEFVLFHSAEANYFQVPASRAKSVADDIAEIVGGESFSSTRGLVGIPYSQANAFFLNCLLPHEMAHFLYQEVDSYVIQTEVDRELERLDQSIGPLESETLSFRRDVLERWIAESFCDLVALCLIGPAFSFAFSELTAASALLGWDENAITDFYSFSPYYPADAARFHLHIGALKKLGWWDEISSYKSAPVQILRMCEQWSPNFFIEMAPPASDSVQDDVFLEKFRNLSAWLIDYVTSRVPTASKALADFRGQSPTISKYLSRAIVPSTIIIGETRIYPAPVVLINSAYQFLLEDMDSLLENIRGEAIDSIRSRSKLAQRLELWVLKALEDNRLLTRQVLIERSSQ